MLLFISNCYVVFYLMEYHIPPDLNMGYVVALG